MDLRVRAHDESSIRDRANWVRGMLVRWRLWQYLAGFLTLVTSASMRATALTDGGSRDCLRGITWMCRPSRST